MFEMLKHLNMKDRASLLICFALKNHSKGTVAIVGGSTSVLMRHVKENHRKEFEAMGKKGEATSARSITRHFASKKKEEELGIKDITRMFVVAATAWKIEEEMPFRMFTRPTFHNTFKPIHKERDQIVNIDSKAIREEMMTMGKHSLETTIKELKGSPISWTTDRWTRPNDELCSTITGHYVDDNWVMQSETLDFKGFHVRTKEELTHDDVQSVLDHFQEETIVVLDTIGITDTTGNIAKLGSHCRENGHRHAYCIHHNYNRNE